MYCITPNPPDPHNGPTQQMGVITPIVQMRKLRQCLRAAVTVITSLFPNELLFNLFSVFILWCAHLSSTNASYIARFY